MPDRQRLQLGVILERDGSDIRGTVDDNAGLVVEFGGWLELMSALDTVCAKASISALASESPEER